MEAWDKDLIVNDLAGSSSTIAGGAFQIEFELSYFKELSLDGSPDLFFKISQCDALIESTEKDSCEIAELAGAKSLLEVDMTDAGSMDDHEQTQQPMKVRGQVRHSDGSILVGKTVRAFDKDLRTEQLLGEHETNSEGRYEIQYSANQFSHAEKKSADLIVRAFDDAGIEIASSAILFNAAAEETIDLVVDSDAYRGPSEYERLVRDLTPLMQGLSFAELTEDDEHRDISFLSGETGHSRQRIEFLIIAHRLAQKTELPPEAFYAFFREGLPTNLHSLILQSRLVLRLALEAALNDHIVPAKLRDQIESIIDMLKQLTGPHLLQAPDGAAKFPDADLLGIAGLSAEEQEKALNLFIENEGPPEDAWKRLRSELKDGPADDLEFTFQMGKLTLNNIPVVKALLAMRGQGIVRTPRDLVRSLDAQAWTELVNTAATGVVPPGVPGATPQEKVTNYVNAIIEALQDRFPTTFAGVGVSRQPQIDTLLIKQVLTLNPNLDPSRPVPSSLDLTGLRADEQVTARQSIDSLHQEIKMFPEFDYQQALSDAGASPQSLLENPIRKGAAKFFDNEPDFEFANTRIDGYMADHPTAFNGIPEQDRAAVTWQLKAMQRVALITPTYEHLEALMGEGLDSAYKIAAIPKRAFVKQFGEAFGGETRAEHYYNIAAQHTATTAALAAGLNDVMNGVTPRAAGDKNIAQAIIKKMPALKELFGSFDLCECKHCRSVYSPAAYFVDLLQFLNPDAGTQPLDALRVRRPDLEHIKLSCENTNTPLPYVDLVNEILEFYVEHGGIKAADGPNLAKDTDISADELSANPQHTSDGAYTFLRDAVHSCHLPFNLPVETARAYLEHLGSSRHEVMEVIQNAGDAQNKNPSDFALACEYLKITPEEATIIMGAAFDPPKLAREFFGYRKDNVVHVLFDDDGKKVLETEGWRKNLARVPEFIQRTGISYLELVELAKTHFINPGQIQDPLPANLIVVFSANSVCDLSQTWIRHLEDTAKIGDELLTDEELLKMHRFLRLWRKLGWSIQELDKALTALMVSDIDGEVLRSLACIERLRVELNLPLLDLLGLWGQMDTVGEDSLYHRLFLNKSVINPVDSAFELTDSNATDPVISDHIPAILAALGINADDLAAIREASNLSSQTEPLTLGNLTILYRHALLAKGLKLKVKELLVLKAMTGVNPFDAPAKTVEFVERARKVKSSGQPIAELNYLYRDISEPAKSVAPTEDDIALLAGALHEGLKAIADDNMPAPDPGGELTRKNLELIWDSPMVEQMMGLIEGSAIYSAPLIELPPDLMLPSSIDTAVPFAYDEPDQMLLFDGKMTEVERSLLLGFSGDPDYQAAVDLLFTSSKPNKKNTVPVKPLQGKMEFFAAGSGRITYDDAANVLQFAGPMSPAEKTILLSLATKDSYLEAINQLFQEPRDFLLDPKAEFLGLDPMTEVEWLLDQEATTADERFGFVLARLLAYLLGRSLVKQTLSDALELEPAVTALLLETVVQSSEDPLAPIIDDFMALLKPNAIDTFRKSFLLINKIALLINGFKMTAAEIAYLSTHGGDFAVFDHATNKNVNFDLNLLSDSQAPSAPVLFSQWERLFDLFSLRDRLPKGPVTLIDLFGAAASLDPSKLDDEVTGALSETTGWDAIRISDLAASFNLKNGDFRNEIKLVVLGECVALGRRAGVSTAQLHKWATEEPGPQQAKEITTTVKAKYDDEQWLTVVKPLNNRLRERRKDALIAYILADSALVEKGITDSNQLFEHFLIDVNMSACFMTSRIKQAISSVQLFVQRCLLNLEEAIPPDAIDADQWNKWMKSYRVWEANRKVFLYPENWIEPELRDDKSPFFREMETQLLQNEVTDETVEQCLLNYLEKLDDVARLDVCGLYWQEKQDGDQSDILHVFGRTFNPPHIYYYRKLRADTGVWTPWEKVNVDIEGDHLVPVVYNRRLQLYWPIFEEKPDKEQNYEPVEIETEEHSNWSALKEEYKAWKKGLDSLKSERDQKQKDYDEIKNDPDVKPEYKGKVEAELQEKKDDVADYEKTEPKPLPGPEPLPATTSEPVPLPPQTHWEIKLAWSEFKDKKWSPKKISAAKISTADYRKNFVPLDTLKSQYRFKSRIDSDGSLLIIPNWAGWVGGGYLSSFDFAAFHVIGCNGRIRIKQPGSWVQSGAPPDTHNEAMTLAEDPGEHRLKLTLGDLASFGTLKSGSTKTHKVLKKTPDTFSLYYTHQLSGFVAQAGLFYQDYRRTYLAFPAKQRVYKLPEFPQPLKGDSQPARTNGSFHDAGVESREKTDGIFSGPAFGSTSSNDAVQAFLKGAPSESDVPVSQEQMGDIITLSEYAASQTKRYLKFITFFHPHVCTFVKALNQKGIPGLVTLGAQQLGQEDQPPDTIFKKEYKPTWVVDPDYPRGIVDFEISGAYSLYNWEMFFHAPLLIADRLSKNQRFEEAMRWFHYVFNPTDDSTGEESPRRFWKFLPFYDNLHPETQQILALLESLKTGDPEVIKQVEEWRDDPFKPHLIARSRITAYQKTVVMKYIDNLIAWGDQLFSRDTIESINEATQLYVMAYHILGRRPEQIPQRVKKVDKTYDDLRSDLDIFSNALVALENEFPFGGDDASDGDALETKGGLGMALTFYFCIPKNEKLLGYWDTIEDRLFKIRHCMNIAGIVRELPLFEPPIDPALLVKAAAMGLDLSSVLNDINSPMPHYRFSHVLQKALELCGELKSLGGALLSALEKKDAEEMSVLRAGHELGLLTAIKEVRKQQIHEAHLALEALQKSRAVAEERHRFYDTIQHRNPNENEYLDQLETARIFQLIMEGLELAGAVVAMIPDFKAGTSGIYSSPVAVVAYGGVNMALAAQATSRASAMVASHHTYQANMASIEGGWARRSDDWNLQKRLAARELDHIDKQIAGAQIRIAIAEKELENHEKQIENSAAVEEFLRNKYTNEELYGWMVSQVSAVFFQSYKLAYDTAKQAEKTYGYELGLSSSEFIQFGYWDSLRKGLLSGERLWLDLKRLEMAYHDLNKREFELTRHASLLQLNPEALLKLRTLGKCTVSLPEELFDLDCPGHYFRRLKSVSLSIPCVAGPYSSVNCKLTLLKSSIRRNSLLNGDVYARAGADDSRFSDHFGSLQSIVTSSGQSDSGMFEMNLRDERYLPFEGSGAISEWQLELPGDIRQFNYDTISDVIIHLRYTAREGGAILRNGAAGNLKTRIEKAQAVGSVRLFSVRHEFPGDWAKFKSETPSNNQAELSIELREEHYPFWSRGILDTIKRVDVYARTEKPIVGITDVKGKSVSLLPDPSLGDLRAGKLADESMPETTGVFTLNLDDQTVTDLWLALAWGKK